MRRREFIAGLGGAAAWPVVAQAQQPAMPVIGFISLGSAGLYQGYVAAFHKGLGETGYVEGRNVTVDTAGRKINTIGCRRSQPISSAAVYDANRHFEAPRTPPPESRLDERHYR